MSHSTSHPGSHPDGSRFDAIVVGAGHNGLTAADVLQQGGLRTVCLDTKASTGMAFGNPHCDKGLQKRLHVIEKPPMPDLGGRDPPGR